MESNKHHKEEIQLLLNKNSGSKILGNSGKKHVMLAAM